MIVYDSSPSRVSVSFRHISTQAFILENNFYFLYKHFDLTVFPILVDLKSNTWLLIAADETCINYHSGTNTSRYHSPMLLRIIYIHTRLSKQFEKGKRGCILQMSPLDVSHMSFDIQHENMCIYYVCSASSALFLSTNFPINR